MNAIAIVSLLLESGAEDFVSGLPSGFFDTFHFVRDGDSAHADYRYRGQVLVYRNNEDGKTRTWIGYIADVAADRWVLTGIARPRRNAETLVQAVGNAKAYGSEGEAAIALLKLYRRISDHSV